MGEPMKDKKRRSRRRRLRGYRRILWVKHQYLSKANKQTNKHYKCIHHISMLCTSVDDRFVGPTLPRPYNALHESVVSKLSSTSVSDLSSFKSNFFIKCILLTNALNAGVIFGAVDVSERCGVACI